MRLMRSCIVAAIAVAASLTVPISGFAQTGDVQPSDQQRTQNQTPDAAKERQRRQAEFAEASQVLKGPAGNPECVRLGRNVVGLLYRDDMDTAFRHIDLYDRFGCPGNHIQAAFRCVLRQGEIDLKQPESLRSRVHSCWVNPTEGLAAQPVPADGTAAAAPPAAAAPTTAPAAPAASSKK